MMLESAGGVGSLERLAKCPGVLRLRFPVSEGMRLPRSGAWVALVVSRLGHHGAFGVVVELMRSWRSDLRALDAHDVDGAFSESGRHRGLEWLERGEALAIRGNRASDVARAVRWARTLALPLFFVHSVPATFDGPTVDGNASRDRGFQLRVSPLAASR